LLNYFSIRVIESYKKKSAPKFRKSKNAFRNRTIHTSLTKLADWDASWNEFNVNLKDFLKTEHVSRPKMLETATPKLQRALDKILEQLFTVMGRKTLCEDCTKDLAATVKQEIYYEKNGQVGKFAIWFMKLLDLKGCSSKDCEVLMSIARHAWNVYPHKELGDRSPAEVIVTSPNEDSRMWF
jgi:hypothetical protein